MNSRRRTVSLFQYGFYLWALLLALGGLKPGDLCAASVYEFVRPFGTLEGLGNEPRTALVRGPDGVFYGTTYVGGTLGQPSGSGALFKVNENGSGYRVLVRFGTAPASGIHPKGELLVRPDGWLYGTTRAGGPYQGGGTLFRVRTDGTGFTNVHVFGQPGDGWEPQGRLVEGGDGAFYGTLYRTQRPGPTGGLVYKIQPDGGGYEILHTFLGQPEDGAGPVAGLTRGLDGTLFGVTTSGGTMNKGTVFRLQENGSGYQVLHSFVGSDGATPSGDLLLMPGGLLYGTTEAGGTWQHGVVFHVNEGGGNFALVHEFGGPGDAGRSAKSRLLAVEDGWLLGTTSLGTNNGGTVFRMQPNGTGYETLHVFPAWSGNVETPWISELVPGGGGYFFGAKSHGGDQNLGMLFKIRADGSGYSTMHTFTRFDGEPNGPGSRPMLASDGRYYGAAGGGSNNLGAIYRFDESGSNLTVIHSLAAPVGTKLQSSIYPEGTGPAGPLIELPGGLLYGMAQSGGISNAGTIYRLNLDGSNRQVMHQFADRPGDGARPLAGLMRAQDGQLYGTTISGGVGFGTLFALNPDGGNYRVLRQFTGADGYGPICTLVQGSSGAIFGTCRSGGNGGRGTVFRVDPDGSHYQVLRHFSAADGGGFPSVGLTSGPDGMLYGTTDAGSSGAGVVFKLQQDGGGYEVLHAFAIEHGWAPNELFLTVGGAILGTTQFGGTYSGQGGVVFRMNLDGSSYEVLHSFPFPIGPYGGRPTCGLVPGMNGAYYGVVPLGGTFNYGGIFRIQPDVPTNHAPVLAAPLADIDAWWLEPFEFTIPGTTFFEEDWGQAATYAVTGLPTGLSFDPATRKISGNLDIKGSFDIQVDCTDSGLPAPLMALDQFQLRVKVPTLSITREGTNMVFRYQRPGKTLLLEESPDPSPAADWIPVSQGGFVSGTTIVVTRPAKPGNWFYRLSKYY